MPNEEKKDINAEEKREEAVEEKAAVEPEKPAAGEEKGAEAEGAGEEKAAEAEGAAEEAGGGAEEKPAEETEKEEPAVRKWIAPKVEKEEEEAVREEEFVERVIKIGRVAKVVKGGKNFSFNAMVVCGDGRGKVGYGLGKANEVVEAIKKGSSRAKADFISVSLTEGTIPHEIIGTFKATRVIMKPAGPGTGVIAGGPVRAMCDAVGIKNILTKSLGSRNSINVIRATMDGFKKLRLKRRG